MKRHIAEFLGELAEELGWEPELTDHRVRGEHDETTHAPLQSVQDNSSQPFPQDPRATPPPRGGSSPAELGAEVKQLRSSLNHLSSEVTQLRAEMARLKNLPAPPDALLDTSVVDSPNVRPWPSHLVPTEESVPVMPASDMIASPTLPSAARVEPAANLDTRPEPARPNGPDATETKRPATQDLSDDAGLDLFPAEPGTGSAS